MISLIGHYLKNVQNRFGWHSEQDPYIFSQILATVSLLVVIVVDAAAVAVVVVVVVVVFDTGFLPLGDTVMIPISCPTVHLVGDVITMSSGLWLLGNISGAGLNKSLLIKLCD